MAAALTQGDAAIYRIAVTVPSTPTSGDYPKLNAVSGSTVCSKLPLISRRAKLEGRIVTKTPLATASIVAADCSAQSTPDDGIKLRDLNLTATLQGFYGVCGLCCRAKRRWKKSTRGEAW
jgi:hypothetical protein